MKNKQIISNMCNSYPIENRVYTCYSHHVAAIVTGHRTRTIDVNIPGKHAEIAAMERYLRSLSLRGRSVRQREKGGLRGSLRYSHRVSRATNEL